jgi:hypothetical protein
MAAAALSIPTFVRPVLLRLRSHYPFVQCDPKFVRNLRFAKANNKRVVKAAEPAAAKKA